MQGDQAEMGRAMGPEIQQHLDMCTGAVRAPIPPCHSFLGKVHDPGRELTLQRGKRVQGDRRGER